MGESSSQKQSEDTASSDESAPSAESAPAPAAAETNAGSEPTPAAEEAATGGEAAAAEDVAAKPKKKKKRRKQEAPTGPVRDPIGPDGRERPAFVLDYPSDPELDRLVKAFELGNYAFVREHAPELAEKAGDARVKAAAAELARRIEPDPLVKVLLGMSLALLVVLALWAYKTHGH
ncbi:MAG TPA: hypothetical protein VGK73_33635 [Polyangiaceae bacterium]